MATVSKWTPFGVALDVTATGGTVTRTSATQYKVVINVSWETYYSGAQTTYGMTAASGGVTHTISAFNGTKRSSGSGSFTGTYSISGNGSATKTVTVTFRNFNDDNDDSATKNVSFSVSVPAWTSYKITFNANGGSGSPGQQTKWKDQTLTLSSTKPTRTGYSFLGWSTSSSATSATYSAGGNYTANSAATLYAVWKANTYTVTYNANGGSGAPGNQTKTYGQTLKLSSTKPTRTNYNFKGWGTSASATTVSYAAGGNYTANAAVTLYAVWELAYTKPRISNLSIVRVKSEGGGGEYSEGLAYDDSWNGSGYAVIGIGTCTDTDIIIPPTYDGLPVDMIDYGAFAYNASITSVVIPDSVTYIDDEAFDSCSNLKSVVVGANVAGIGMCTFASPNIERIDFSRHSFIPEINDDSFYDNGEIEILVPANLYDEWIEATNWSEYADCIVAVEGGGSEYSEGLEYTDLACLTDGCEVTGRGSCADTDIVIPPYCEDGAVTEICTSAFEGDDTITSVVIPDTVTHFDDDAFWGCANLTSVVMGSSVDYLGMNAFGNCGSLERVDFSKHTFIPEMSDDSAFYDAPIDLQIIVPDNLYNEWKAATNWSDYADNIVKASDAGGGGGEVVWIESDDGENAKVTLDWACDKTISSIVIKWKLTTESTYSNSRTVTASGTSGTVTEILDDDTFDTESSYDIHVTVTDSNGSSYAVGVLFSMSIVLDFLAGGKGASAGKVAELEGVFDVGFKTRLFGGLLYPILEPGTDLNTVLTPNTYAGENSNAANYGNCPITSGTFTLEVMSAGPNGQILQRLTVCDKTKPAVYERFYYTSAWGEWYGGWIYPTLGSDFVMYGTDTTANRTRYRKDGRIVEVRGIVKPAVSLPKSGGTNTTSYTIFTLPVGYRPTSPIYSICQGSGNCVWMLQVNSTGAVTFSRYRNGNTNATADTGAWLPFQVTFLAN